MVDKADDDLCKDLDAMQEEEAKSKPSGAGGLPLFNDDDIVTQPSKPR